MNAPSEAASRAPVLAALRHTGALLQRLPRAAGVVLALGWIGTIWFLSDQSPSDEPHAFGTSWLSNTAHAPLFGLLAFWMILGLERSGGWPRFTRRALTTLLLLALAYGCIDEWHQSHTPGRFPSVWDVVTDLVGASCTLWIVRYVGTSAASEQGLRGRLVIGLLLCALAGLVSSLL